MPRPHSLLLVISQITHRDWFRINPLDMVLLGCQSVLTNSATKREVYTCLLHSHNPMCSQYLYCASPSSHTIPILYRASTQHLQNVTMVLAMSPLAGHMLQRPRYWLRTFSVLCATITCEDIPAVILQVGADVNVVASGWLIVRRLGQVQLFSLQRCCSMLLSLWRRIQEVEE